MRLLDVPIALGGALLIATGFAMPLLVPEVGSALLAWLAAFVLLVACSRKLEAVSPGAVAQLWTMELRIMIMCTQVALDHVAPHLGDAMVPVAYLVLITLTLRMSNFAHARIVGQRAPRAPRHYLAYVPMLLLTLPAIGLVVAGIQHVLEIEK